MVAACRPRVAAMCRSAPRIRARRVGWSARRGTCPTPPCLVVRSYRFDRTSVSSKGEVVPEHVGRCTSPQARQRFLAAYQEAMRLWPQPYAELDVQTRFGSTHVFRHGDGPPVVLLHGAAG